MRTSLGRAIAGAVLAVVILYGIYAVRHALLMIYLAVLLAILFDPAVGLVQRLRVHHYRPGRGVATAIVTLATAGLLLLVALIVVPPLAADAGRLATTWPEQSRHGFDWLHRHIPLTKSVTPDTVKRWLHAMSGGAPLMTVGAGVMDTLVTLLLAIYMLADGRKAFDWMLSMVPDRHRADVRGALVDGARRTQRWVGGQGILMLTHGGSAFFTFWAIGLPYFATLAVFAAFINIIPVLGPVLTLLVAGLVAVTTSPGKLLAVVIFYLVYHNIEGAVLQPRIMAAAVGLPGVAVVAALMIGDEIAGFVGMAFSVPTAVLVAALKNHYVDRGGSRRPGS